MGSCTSRQVKRSAGFLPVLMLVALYGWVYYVYVFDLCWSYLLRNGHLMTGVLYILLFHAIFALHVYSYYRTVFTSPGHPSANLLEEGSDFAMSETVHVNELAPHHQPNTEPPFPASATARIPSTATSIDPSIPLLVRGAGITTSSHRQNTAPPLLSLTVAVPDSATPSSLLDSVGKDHRSPPPLHNDAGHTAIHVDNDHQVQRLLRDAPATSSASIALASVTAKHNGRPRYCNKCATVKPDRAHHCSICERCVLKMDHHCPWVNNCVGFANQKFFVLFCGYGALLGLYVALTVLPLFNATTSATVTGQPGKWLFLMLAGVVFGLALVAFTSIHVYYVISNKTTIETFEKNRYKGAASSNNHENYVNVFDLGSRRSNWEQVMGTDVRLWFVPVGNSLGNGMTFPLNERAWRELQQKAAEAEAERQRLRQEQLERMQQERRMSQSA